MYRNSFKIVPMVFDFLNLCLSINNRLLSGDWNGGAFVLMETKQTSTVLVDTKTNKLELLLKYNT